MEMAAWHHCPHGKGSALCPWCPWTLCKYWQDFLSSTKCTSAHAKLRAVAGELQPPASAGRSLPCTGASPAWASPPARTFALKGLPASETATPAPPLAQRARADPQPSTGQAAKKHLCVSPRESPQPCSSAVPGRLTEIRLEDDHFMLSSRQHKARLLPIPFFPLIVLFPCACARPALARKAKC